jgi:hypothetical protein
MKVAPEKIGMEHVGCLCLVSWRGEAFGFTGHSARHGLEGSGTVPTSNLLVGRLCHADEEKLTFLTAWHRHHSMGMAFLHGPHDSVENHDVFTVQRDRISRRTPVYVNRHEKSSSIRQHLVHKDKKSGIWQVWPRLAAHWKEL